MNKNNKKPVGSTLNGGNIPDPLKLKNIIKLAVYTKSLAVAAELNIADHLKDTPKSAAYLAQATGSNANALYRLIRLLASEGVFHITKTGLIEQSSISHFLRADVENSQKDFVRMIGSHWMWDIYNHLDYSIKTGNAAAPEAFAGASFWEYLHQQNPAGGKLFSNSMSHFSNTFDSLIVDAYEFAEMQTLVDIGGAEGRLLKIILKRFPHLQGTLFDTPSVIKHAETLPDSADIQYKAGNFFEEIGVEADCLLLKFVLHNYQDDNCIKILKNCRKSVTDNGRLLVMDLLMQPNDVPSMEKSMDVMMLMLLGSAERTEEEFAHLFVQAGWQLQRVISTKSPLFILEAVPIAMPM